MCRGLFDFAPHFGVKSPPPKNFNFGGMNRHFQAKRAKYWKFHIIESTASISIKFCTMIETTKWSSWVVPICAQQIQDGGQSPFKKTVKSPYLWNCLTNFDEIWHTLHSKALSAGALATWTRWDATFLLRLVVWQIEKDTGQHRDGGEEPSFSS